MCLGHLGANKSHLEKAPYTLLTQCIDINQDGVYKGCGKERRLVEPHCPSSTVATTDHHRPGDL